MYRYNNYTPLIPTRTTRHTNRGATKKEFLLTSPLLSSFEPHLQRIDSSGPLGASSPLADMERSLLFCHHNKSLKGGALDLSLWVAMTHTLGMIAKMSPHKAENFCSLRQACADTQ
jgi:hypothetical protein